MSCNCKSQNINDMIESDTTKLSVGKLIGKYTLKVITFLVLLVLLPFINLAIIWFMFSTLVLNKDVNIKPLLTALGNQFKPKEYDEDDIDEEEFNSLTEDDVVLVDVEEITNKSK